MDKLHSYHQETGYRNIVTSENIRFATVAIAEKIHRNMLKRGPGTFINTAEMLGVITEEYHEVINACHSRERNAITKELLDLAAAALFGYITLVKGGE